MTRLSPAAWAYIPQHLRPRYPQDDPALPASPGYVGEIAEVIPQIQALTQETIARRDRIRATARRLVRGNDDRQD